MSSRQELSALYQQDPRRKGKVAFRGGTPTKDFLRINRMLIREGKADLYALPSKVYNPETGAFVDRYTKSGRVKRKFRAENLVGSVIKNRSLPHNTITVNEGLSNYYLAYKVIKDNNISGKKNMKIIIGGQVVFDTDVDIPNPITKAWYDSTLEQGLQVESGVAIYNQDLPVKFIFTPEKKLTPRYITQTFADNSQSTCIFNPILRWAEEMKENVKSKSSKKKYDSVINYVSGKQLKNEFKEGLIHKYPNGVPQNEINEVVHLLNIGIDIYQPCADEPFLSFRPVKGDPRKVFKYINTRLDHVEAMPEGKGNFWGKTYSSQHDYTVVSRNELVKMANQFRKEKKPFIYGKDIYGINSIKTEDQVFRMDESYDDVVQEFIEDHKMWRYRIDRKEHTHLVDFLLLGTHFNGTRDFEILDHENQNWDDVGHADMKAAYVNYDKSKYYNGFAMKFHDFRPMDNYDEAGFYLVNNIDDSAVESNIRKIVKHLSWFHNKNIYTQAELRAFADIGFKFKVVYGAIDLCPVDINMRDWNEGAMVETKAIIGNDDEIPAYCKYVGSCARVSENNNFYVSCDADFAQTICDEKKNVYYNEVEGAARVVVDNTRHYTLTHFAAQITAYQRVLMLQQLEKIPYDDIYRVCVDGIYLKKKAINYDLVAPFRVKEEEGDMTWLNFECEHYLSNIQVKLEDGLWSAYQTIDMSVPRHIFKSTVLMKGAGGTGKTYGLKKDKGLIDVLYATPSWLLASRMDNEKWIKSVHYRLGDKNKIARGIYDHANIVVDECSMLTEEEKEEIMDNACGSGARVFFLGDLQCQMPPCEGDMMRESGFEEIIEKKYVYRFLKGDDLHELARNIRGMMNYPTPVVLKRISEKVKKITTEEMIRLYKPTDAIIAHSNKTCDEYTELFPTQEKYRILECKNVDGVDRYNGEIVFEEPKNIKYEKRHGFTIHSYQGSQVEIGNKLFIDAQSFTGVVMFQGAGQIRNRLLYTAISRARSIDQIYLVY
jgi:hypothetical protein